MGSHKATAGNNTSHPHPPNFQVSLSRFTCDMEHVRGPAQLKPFGEIPPKKTGAKEPKIRSGTWWTVLKCQLSFISSNNAKWFMQYLHLLFCNVHFDNNRCFKTIFQQNREHLYTYWIYPLDLLKKTYMITDWLLRISQKQEPSTPGRSEDDKIN